MDLLAQLQPPGRPFKAMPYALAVSFVGVSGSFVVSLQYGDYVWAMTNAVFAVLAPFLVLGSAAVLRSIGGQRLSTPWVMGLAVVTGCVATQIICLFVSEQLLGMEPHPDKGYLYRVGLVRGPLLFWALAAAAWYAVKHAEWRAQELSRAELAEYALRASTAEARLQALQAQVEPHFLFNTLAHVRWLYRRDAVRGRRMMASFLDYLAAALPRVRQSATTLEQELQLARAYLDLQQLRIGERLEFAIDVPKEIADVRFPPLMLLTLVENAIKHGIAPQPEGGHIGILAKADAQRLRIEVRDDGAGLRQASGSGMGLANVRERLAAIFGAGAKLIIEPNFPNGVVAAIEIPRA